METNERSVEWFLDFFGAIDSRDWTIGEQSGWSASGQRVHCALGHINANRLTAGNEIATVNALAKIMKPIAAEFYSEIGVANYDNSGVIICVNDTENERLTGKNNHPKSRIMAILKLALKRAKREPVID
jgi:hypothetical protein